MAARFSRLYLTITLPALMLSLFMPAPIRAQNQTSVLNQRQKNQLKRLSNNVKKGQQSLKKGQQSLKKGQQTLKKAQGVLQANKVAVKAKGAIPAKQRAQLQHDANQARRAINQLNHAKKAQSQ